MARFSTWKDKQPNGNGSPEIKGTALTPLQQASFARTVLLESRAVCLTLAGTKTSLFDKKLAQAYVKDSVRILRAAAKRALDLEKPRIAEHFGKMASWMEKRSPENLMWLFSLVDAIRLSVHHSIAMFSDDADACEFENIEILIDRSFIQKPKHVGFWQEWLRDLLFNASLKDPFPVIKEWPQDHPFRAKYVRQNHTVEMSEIFRDNTRFVESREVLGVQMADICANIAYRFYSGKRKYRPYRLLRSRIIGRHQSQIHYGILDVSSLLTDAPANHVRFYSEEDLAAWGRPERDR